MTPRIRISERKAARISHTVRTETPENSGIAPSADYREHRRVVNEKDANKESQEREGLQVEAKGLEHAGERLTPLAGRLNEEPFAPSGAEAGFIR